MGIMSFAPFQLPTPYGGNPIAEAQAIAQAQAQAAKNNPVQHFIGGDTAPPAGLPTGGAQGASVTPAANGAPPTAAASGGKPSSSGILDSITQLFGGQGGGGAQSAGLAQLLAMFGG
jgi:hypothetical protein